MSKEMRENIDRIKNWEQFNEGHVNSVNLEKYLQELIETKSKLNDVTDDNQKLYEHWISLIENIKDYYKLKLESEFNKNGKWGVLYLFNNDITSFLQKEEYEEYTYIIRFDLTEYTRNLIKKGG